MPTPMKLRIHGSILDLCSSPAPCLGILNYLFCSDGLSLPPRRVMVPSLDLSCKSQTMPTVHIARLQEDRGPLLAGLLRRTLPCKLDAHLCACKVPCNVGQGWEHKEKEGLLEAGNHALSYSHNLETDEDSKFIPAFQVLPGRKTEHILLNSVLA